jgi:hypothetical protein
MAARFTGQFYSAYTEQQYTVIVYDADFSGASSEIVVASCEYNYPQGNAGRFDPVLSAEASIRILVQTSGVDTFVDDLAGAEEGRFMLQILQGLSSQFIGYILPDLAQQEDTTLEVGYLLELRATDGLARLKTIDYNNNGTAYGGEAAVSDHILNCLNKLTALMDFYGGSSELLKTRINWHSDQHTYTVGDEDPAELTRIPHRAFYTIDSRGNYKYKSCFDVLTEICRAWGARMLFSDYAFWVVQYNELATDAAMTVFSYTKTGTQTSASVDFRKDHDQTDDASDLVRRAGGIYRFYPPLMKAQVDYRHIQTRNLLAGQVFTQAGLNSPYVVGDVSDFGGIARFSVSFNMIYRAENRDDPPGVVGLWFVFGIRIEVDSLYLDRDCIISGGNPVYSGAVTWSGTSSARYEVAMYVPENEDDNFDSVYFLTPFLPASGEFVFDITLDRVYRADGTEYVTPVADYIWRADNLYVEHLYEGTLDQQSDIRRFKATNNTDGNSAMVEITTIIGDGIGTNSPGHLESYDGSNWVLSDGWRVGASGSYLAHGALLAQEVVRGQLTPIRKFQGEYNNRNTSIYKPHHVIKRADGIMVFAGGRFAPAIDSIQGEWYFISPQVSGWTNEAYEDIQPDTEGGSITRPGGGGSIGGGTVSPMRIFSQHFDTVTANTVTVTVNGGTLPTNADALLVFWNGQLITSAFYTVTGSDIEFDFDVTDNVTVKFFIQ